MQDAFFGSAYGVAALGFFFGAISILILTNLVQATIEKERKYLSYGCYLLLAATSCAYWLYLSTVSTALAALLLLTCSAHITFSRYYFHCKKNMPSWNRYLMALGITGLILVPLMRIDSIRTGLLCAFGLATFISTFVLAIYTSSRGFGRSRSYILTRFCATPIVLMLIAMVTGVIAADKTIFSAALLALLLDGASTTYTLVQRQIRHMHERLLTHYNLSVERAQKRQQGNSLRQISHDIRTPISGVLGMSELLLETSLNRNQRDQVQIIHRTGESLLRWLNGVSDWAALQAGRLKFKNIPFDFVAVIRDCTDALKEVANARQVNIQTVLDQRLPKLVKGDPERLQQVLRGLFDFALYYSEQGQLNFCATLTGEKNRWLLELTDTHSGLRPEDLKGLDSVFDEQNPSDLSPVEMSVHQRNWSLAARLCEMMQGSLNVSFDPATNMDTVRYRCELLLPRHTLLSHSEAKYDELLKGKRLLVIDDSHSSRKIVAKRAEQWQMRVTTAPNGEEALAMMRTVVGLGGHFDLIILDYDLRGLNGLELAEAISRDLTLGNPAIIMLSGASTAPNSDTAAASGIRRVLSKPISTQSLKITLAEELTVNNVRPRTCTPTPLGTSASKE
jgi:signal transduction histidine kinase/ActR/RegA family two-component response regulator